MMKILVCDDSLLVRRMFKEALEEIGDFDIHYASNGHEAVEVYEKESPALVFMDLIMPVMDGLECLKNIRGADENANVVMVSSVRTKENLSTAIGLGAIDFIQKPWEEGQLINTLSKLKG